ncbi:MAG: hypothetical protein ACTHQ3_13340 [Motilibacteraceae bacterium]
MTFSAARAARAVPGLAAAAALDGPLASALADDTEEPAGVAPSAATLEPEGEPVAPGLPDAVAALVASLLDAALLGREFPFTAAPTVPAS